MVPALTPSGAPPLARLWYLGSLRTRMIYFALRSSAMPDQQLDLNTVTHLTTGAIGPPGQRVFYLQARAGGELVTLIVEKVQVQSLAVGLEQFLVELARQFPDLAEASAAYDVSAMELEQPVDPVFRVGQIGLGYDQSSDRIVVVAREQLPEGSDPEQA